MLTALSRRPSCTSAGSLSRRRKLAIDKPSLQLKLYNETLKKGLSVRQVEQRAKQYQQADALGEDMPEVPTKRKPARDYAILQKHLTGAFGVPVKVSCNALGKGKIAFAFSNTEQLERIITLFDQLKSK